MFTTIRRSLTPARRCVGATAALALAATGLAACSSSDSSGEGAGDRAALTILTHDSFTLPDELLAQFEESTGYELTTISPGDGATVLGQLVLTKDHPQADGVFGLSAYTVMNAVNEGVLAEYTSPALPESAAAYDIDSHVTPTDLGAVCVNADDAWFAAHNRAIPSTLDELAEAGTAELLVVENPVESETGAAFLIGLAATRGIEGALAYYEQLLDGGAKVNSSWSDAYYSDFSGADGEGAYPLVLSYSSSPAEAEGATSLIEATCTQQVEYAGVIEGAQNPEGAKAFIDFLLSPEVQAAFPEAMYMYPVDSSVALPQAWAQWASLPESALEYDAREVATQREAWLKAWTAMFEAR